MGNFKNFHCLQAPEKNNDCFTIRYPSETISIHMLLTYGCFNGPTAKANYGCIVSDLSLRIRKIVHWDHVEFSIFSWKMV